MNFSSGLLLLLTVESFASPISSDEALSGDNLGSLPSAIKKFDTFMVCLLLLPLHLSLFNIFKK